MSDEEKKAIERLSLKAITSSIEAPNYPNAIVMKRDLVTVLNLIEKKSKEIEELKYKVREHICIEAHEQVKQLYISKDRIKEILHLTDEECDSEGKILSLLKTIWDEFNRLEDIEDRKVQVDYERVFNKGVKSVENKIKAKIEEIDEILKGQLIEKIRVYFEAQKEVLESLLKE